MAGISIDAIKNALPDPIKHSHNYMWHVREEIKYDSESVSENLDNDYSAIIE
jgi:hypothetical protein